MDSGIGASVPSQLDGVELGRAAERVERGQHARPHPLGLLAARPPRAARPSRARSRTARRRRGGSRRRPKFGSLAASVRRPNSVRMSGSHSRSAAARAASGSSASAHSSQPSCEPAPGNGDVAGLQRHDVRPVALAEQRAQRVARRVHAGSPVSAPRARSAAYGHRLRVGVGQRRRGLRPVRAHVAAAVRVGGGVDRVAPALLGEPARAAGCVAHQPAARVERAASQPAAARAGRPRARLPARPPAATRNHGVASAVP